MQSTSYQLLDLEMNHRLTPVDAEPGLLGDVQTYINQSAPAALLRPLSSAVEELEDILTEQLSQRRILPEQVDGIRHQLIGLLITLQMDPESETSAWIMGQIFRHHHTLFLVALSRDLSPYERLFCLYTPEAHTRCEWIVFALEVFLTLSSLASVSLFLALCFISSQNKYNHETRDLIELLFMIAATPLLVLIYGLFGLFVLLKIFEPCTDYYLANMAHDPREVQGQAIARQIQTIFEQNLPRSLNDFIRDPARPARNIRDLALKLWLEHITTCDLLTSTHLQHALQEYAHYLDENNTSFEQTVDHHFMHQLLTYKVDSRNVQLKSAIVSTEEISQEQTLMTAIEAIKIVRRSSQSIAQNDSEESMRLSC